MTQHVVVYSDLNCPFCYALNERLGTWRDLEKITWRGVQHAPHLQVPMAPWRADMAEDLRSEVQAVRRLAPELPITAPTGKPNTAEAIRAVASAYSLGLQGAVTFKDLLYRALWYEGADLSDPATIAYLAEKAGLGRTVLSALDNRLASATTSRWQQDWEATGIGAVPALVRPDGTRLVGLVGQDRLRAFLRPDTGTAKRP